MKHIDKKSRLHTQKVGMDLAQAIHALANPEQCFKLLQDLCTPAELEAIVDRWRVARLLEQGMPYRQIHERTGVSVTTVGRVARYLIDGSGGYAAALATLSKSSKQKQSPKSSSKENIS